MKLSVQSQNIKHLLLRLQQSDHEMHFSKGYFQDDSCSFLVAEDYDGKEVYVAFRYISHSNTKLFTKKG